MALTKKVYLIIPFSEPRQIDDDGTKIYGTCLQLITGSEEDVQGIATDLGELGIRAKVVVENRGCQYCHALDGRLFCTGCWYGDLERV